LFNDGDLKNAAPYFFGENFGPLAKECLEASNALKWHHSLTREWSFQKGHFKEIIGHGVHGSSTAGTLKEAT